MAPATTATHRSFRRDVIGGSQIGSQPDRLVQAAQPVALEIERDELIADLLERPHDRVAHLGLERARHLAGADLDPRDLVVMTDAAHAEAEPVEDLLRLLDLPQLLVRDFGVIRNPRRQARRGGLVPRRHAGPARQRADLGFGQAHFVERAAHAEFLRRLTPRPVVAAIVRVVAVEHDRESAVARERRQMGIELVLAVVAAVDRIRAVLGPLQLAGLDDQVRQRELPRHLFASAR